MLIMLSLKDELLMKPYYTVNYPEATKAMFFLAVRKVATECFKDILHVASS